MKMPIYEFRCLKCGRKFEELKSLKEGIIDKCPYCGCGKLIRLMSITSPPAFRGTGFYETDYKKKKERR